VRLFAFVWIAASLLATADGWAYCRTSACGSGVEGTRCDPPQSADCGNVIRWERDCIGFTVHREASSQVSVGTAQQLLQQALQQWMNADCGSGDVPSIHIADLGAIACGDVEYNQKSGNANVVVFRDDVWPHDEMVNALALTTVTYDVNTGEIFDADIEVNGTRNLVENSAGDWYDLLGVLTHETGHALGLAHTPANTATMNATIGAADTSYRDLGADDMAGICAIYAGGPPVDPECNPIPRHGFSEDCKVDQDYADCSFHPAAQDLPIWVLVLMGATCVRRRRAVNERRARGSALRSARAGRPCRRSQLELDRR
jgi:hypothetical protein